MTLVLRHDLDMVKMYHHTENEVSMSGHSKVLAQMDRQTQYENITFPHTRAVIKVRPIGKIYRNVRCRVFECNVTECIPQKHEYHTSELHFAVFHILHS